MSFPVQNNPSTSQVGGSQLAPQVSSARLGGRDVTVGDAQAPRAQQETGFFAGIKRLGERILNAITPFGVRTESKVRLATEDYSAKMQSTLERASSGNTKSLYGSLAQLRETAKPLTARGQDYDQLLQKQMSSQLKGMSDDQLNALRTKLSTPEFARAKELMLDGPTDQERQLVGALVDMGMCEPYDIDSAHSEAIHDTVRDLSTLEALVGNEIYSRAEVETGAQVDSTLGEALLQVPREASNKGAVSYIMATVFSAGDTFVQKLQDSGRVMSADQEKNFASGAVKEGLERMKPEDRTSLLQNMSSKDLQRLSKAEHALGAKTPETDAAIKKEITDRHTRLTESFTMKADYQASRSYSSGAPGMLAKELSTLASVGAELREHATRFGLPMEKLDEGFSKVAEKLDSLNSSQAKLGELTNKELSGMSTALKFFGVEHLDGAIATERTTRREKSEEAYMGSFDQLRKGLASGNTSDIVSGLKGLNTGAQHVLDTENEMGTGLEGADDMTELREELMLKAFNKLSAEDQLAFVTELNKPGTEQLSEGMLEAGYKVLNGFPDTGKAILSASTDLLLLKSALTRNLQEKGVELPETAPYKGPRDAEALKQMKSEARAVLREQFGVSVNEQGQVSMAGSVGKTPEVRDTSVSSAIVRTLDSLVDPRADVSTLLGKLNATNGRLYGTLSQGVLVDAGARQDAKNDAIRKELKGCSTEQLQAMAKNLRSPEMLNLRAALAFAATNDVFESDDLTKEQGYALAQAGSMQETLKAFDIAIRGELADRGVELPDPKPTTLLDSAAQMSPRNRDGVMDALGKIARNAGIPQLNKTEVLPDTARLTFDSMLVKPGEDDVLEAHSLGDGTKTSIDPTTWVDFGRATHQILDGDVTTEILDRDGFSSLASDKQDERRLSAQDKLIKFCGDDPETALLVSQYMSQKNMAGLEAILMSPDSPVMINGKLGIPVREQGSVTYTLSRQEDGQLKVHAEIEWTMKGVIVDGEMIPVDRASSKLTLSADIVINPETRGITAGPVGAKTVINPSPDLSVD